MLELSAPSPWTHEAACVNSPTDLFYKDNKRSHWSRADIEDAVSICRTCPVIQECLAFAFRTHDQWAILGGTTPDQRTAMLKRGKGWSHG